IVGLDEVHRRQPALTRHRAWLEERVEEPREISRKRLGTYQKTHQNTSFDASAPRIKPKSSSVNFYEALTARGLTPVSKVLRLWTRSPRDACAGPRGPRPRSPRGRSGSPRASLPARRATPTAPPRSSLGATQSWPTR